jgi:aspartate/methionine/tyrosine aminotransferase
MSPRQANGNCGTALWLPFTAPLCKGFEAAPSGAPLLSPPHFNFPICICMARSGTMGGLEEGTVRIDLFKMERNQSQHENSVDYNLSESGVQPMTVAELLEGSSISPEQFLALDLKYPQSNGTEELRERIGAFYGGRSENVVVTNGGSEANYTSLWGLLEKGDRVAVMLPNYMQTWGLARAYGAAADEYWLTEQTQAGKRRWALDIEGLHRAVNKKTKLIVVTNPNNPTGGVLTEEEMAEIIRVARKANAWLLADEIYRGAEIECAITPTFWGRYDKVLITSGLSKAFGLPGLRIGWIVGPPSNIAKLWSYRDYTTLTPNLVSERLSWIAMEPTRRDAILARTRSILQSHLPRLERWIRKHDDIFTYVAPVAGAIAYIRYRLGVSSSTLCARLRDEHSVLINPGDHFGGGKYLRVGFGYDMDYTLRGLERADALLNDLKNAGSRASRLQAARSGAA